MRRKFPSDSKVRRASGRKLILDPADRLPAARWRAMSSRFHKLAEANGEKISVIPAIKQSNDLHRGWAFRRLQSRLGDLRGKKISILGLTYTTNTDTLRRSAAVELCQQLLAAGAEVSAFDPAVKILPPELKSRFTCRRYFRALAAAEAVAVCTEWPQFRQADWAKIVPQMRSAGFRGRESFSGKGIENHPRHRASFRRSRLT